MTRLGERPWWNPFGGSEREHETTEAGRAMARARRELMDELDDEGFERLRRERLRQKFSEPPPPPADFTVRLSCDASRFVHSMLDTGRAAEDFGQKLKLARIKDSVRVEARHIVRQGFLEAHPWINRCVVRGSHASWQMESFDPDVGILTTSCMGCGKVVVSVDPTRPR